MGRLRNGLSTEDYVEAPLLPPLLAEYERVLSRIHQLLEVEGHEHWSRTLAGWLAEYKTIDLSNGDHTRLTLHMLRTRSAFGGMGSLNDLLLSDPQADELLANLGSRLYQIVKEILDEPSISAGLR